MNSRKALLLVLAKTAQSDGQVVPSERDFLQEMCELMNQGSVDDVLEQAKSADLKELVDVLDNYADRFFVALRAYMMAQVDLHFDIQEEAFFNTLVASLSISAEDLQLIEQSNAGLLSDSSDEPNERVLELYRESSFCTSE